ncbi:MAG: GNAT family N-acetyltransferase [Chloroflexota bacterium]|nr:GNAT family N-acetyltransferase [Chloroflexota bacterium]
MFSVRPYRAHDAAQVERLYASVANPYRQEDADNVLAMQRRALHAQEAGDRWSPLKTDEPDVGEQAHLAFWVAVATSETDEEVIGTLGLRRVGDEETARSDTAERSGLPSIGQWISSGDVGEIRRLRVALEWRRRGVATALTRHLTTASVESLRLRSLVLNTTAAQIPALAFYRRLGFKELGRSCLGAYELVWMHLQIEPEP